MIEGVIIKPLKVLRDERGQVMHMLRCDDPLFKSFGEIYFSVVNPGVVKGWKKHQRMTQHFCVPRGTLKLVIFDDRASSTTRGVLQEIVLGEQSYQLAVVPPGVWYGFTPADDAPAMIANCSDIPHDPLETESLPLGDARVPYIWAQPKEKI